jgi:hypothetical protein
MLMLVNLKPFPMRDEPEGMYGFERIRISVGEAFKKPSPSNPISHESVFKLNGKLIHSAAPIKGFSLSFVHHISQREPQ